MTPALFYLQLVKMTIVGVKTLTVRKSILTEFAMWPVMTEISSAVAKMDTLRARVGNVKVRWPTRPQPTCSHYFHHTCAGYDRPRGGGVEKICFLFTTYGPNFLGGTIKFVVRGYTPPSAPLCTRMIFTHGTRCSQYFVLTLAL